MKFLTEHIDTVEFITEGTGAGRKYAIEGVFMQAEKPNRNNRVYPRKILFNAVDKYVNEQVIPGRAVGELNHPNGPTINLDKVSHRITKLTFDGNNVVGKALILDTPMGQIVQGLLNGGVRLGVSSRGMGSVEKNGKMNMVKEDFVLATVDIVQDPSAYEAFVEGLMEQVDWVYENGMFKPQQLEIYETKIKKASSKNLTMVQEEVFKDFLSKL